jgi:putative ATP-dependent endonuclease of the OLD family
LSLGRSSQLARLLPLLADETGIDGINKALQELDGKLKAHLSIVTRIKPSTPGTRRCWARNSRSCWRSALSASDFKSLKSRLSLLVDAFEIGQNGLGFNNLIYMAVVLSELTKNPECCYRGLIVE